jgi:hypothetical protein
MKKLNITFSVNDVIEKEYSISLTKYKKDNKKIINEQIKIINQAQDKFIEKWETQFPVDTFDRQFIDKLDTDGYYIDGYLFMRKLDLKRGYFEARMEII